MCTSPGPGRWAGRADTPPRTKPTATQPNLPIMPELYADGGCGGDVIGWTDGGDQALGARLFGRPALGTEQVFEGAGTADVARQALCASPSGNQTQLGAVMAEIGQGRADTGTAGESEIEAASEACA